MNKMKKTRKPGGGRKKLKPEYDAGKNLKEQTERAVARYNSEMSLQAIGEELRLNPIKVRKLLITAGVYESEVSEKVQDTFEEYRETQDYQEKNRKFMEDSDAEVLWIQNRRVLSLPNVAVKPLAFINEWVGSLSGKSSSVENKIIVIRQFLEFLKHTGESVAMPSIPSLR